MNNESGLIYAYAYGPGFKSSYWTIQFFPQFLKFLSLMIDFYTHCCRALNLALARLSCFLNSTWIQSQWMASTENASMSSIIRQSRDSECRRPMSRSRETRDFSLSAASVCTIHSTRRRSHRRSRYMSDLGVRSSSAESTRCSSFSPLARPFSASQTGTYVQRHIRLNYSNTATNAFTDISLIMSTVSATNSPLSFSGTF